jgi:hypothetical protein
VPNMTVTRALLALFGLSVSALQSPILTTEATRALRPLLVAHGFDTALPIRVRELADTQGFHLEQ